jgi:lysozyme
MTTLTVSSIGRALTMQFEGCDLDSYPDPGTRAAPYTCGYGHTGPDVKKGMHITQSQADAWLAADLAKAAAVVNASVSVPLTQNQFDALTDFVFNVGAGNFRASTLLRLLNKSDYAGAADQFPRWGIAAGKVMPGLVRRRNAERALFTLGTDFPKEPQPQQESVQ